MKAILKDELDHLLMLSLENVITEDQILKLHRLINQDFEVALYCIDYLNVASCLRKSSGRLNDILSSDSYENIGAKGILAEAIERDEKIRSEKAAEEASRQAVTRKAEAEKAAAKAFKEFQEQERRRQEKLAYKRYKARQRKLIFGITSLAASLIFIASAWIIHYKSTTSVISPLASTIIASVSDSYDARWGDPELSTQAGTELIAGSLHLTKGFVEITFGKGTKIILEAPAKIELEDTNHLLLREGRLSAKAPPEASGFTVDSPNASFMDIGTEFGVNVSENGQSELQVFQGEVMLFAGMNRHVKRIRQTVKAGEAKRIHALNAEISDIPWGKADYIRRVPSAYELALRKSKPLAYWNFEQEESKLLLIDRMNQDHNSDQSLGRMKLTKGPNLGGGKAGNALQFTGNNAHVYIPKFEDLQEIIPRDHTYVFWVRVDKLKSQDILVETNEGTVQYRHFGISEDGHFVHLTYYFKKKEIRDTLYSKVKVQPGLWYHIAIAQAMEEKSGKKIMCLFINGREGVSQQVQQTYAPRFSGHFYLGSSPAEGEMVGIGSFVGAIAEIAEYNRALSAEEIKQLYLSAQ
jgi:hypothetical protein